MSKVPAMALLLPAISGCTELEPFLPTIAFERIDVLGVDWDGVDADFVFRVDNPNPIDIKLARFDYGLSFAGVEWLAGDDPDGLELAASDGSELSLPVGVEFVALYEMVQAIRGVDDIPFTLAGSFGFDTPIGLVELPYDAGGDFPALRVPAFELGKVRVDQIDWTSATFEVDVNVDNDHGSNLWFRDFDYAIQLSGTQVASGLIADLGGVDGATTDTFSIPIEVSFLEAGVGLYDALTSDRVDIGLDAATHVDTPFGVVPLHVDEAGQVSVQ